jgi:hypothetical protein
MMFGGHWRHIVLLACALFAVGAAAPAHAATVVVVNNDGANEGFNDSTVAVPVGGNIGTTIGQQRLVAFQFAADIWGARLSSAVPIRVNAQFDSLDCNASSAVLGSAGPENYFRDFAGAPAAGTWYPVALVNALTGADNDPGFDDIGANFNSDIGAPGCLESSGWYYGLDGNPPVGKIDFVSVLLHELGHGLGFVSLVSLTTGAKAIGFDDAYMRNLELHGGAPADFPSMSNAQRLAATISPGNLHWVGANVRAASGVLSAGKVGDHVRMYAPNPAQPGSSVSHFDTALVPSQLMEPSYTGALHDPVLELPLFQDLGWSMPAAATAPSAPTAVVATAGNANLTLNFNAPASPGTVLGGGSGSITGYSATCSPSGSGNSVGAATTIAVASLANGTAYTCTVRATNSAGLTGPASTASNSVSPTAATAPSAPIGVTATAGNGSLSLNFTAPASPGTTAGGGVATITGYSATCSPGGSGNSVGAATAITVAGLANGTAYTCTVRATNSAGLTGPASSASSSVTPSVPPISRTYVAIDGSDANGPTYSCNFAHPCRTFQTAFSRVTDGGEVLAVDGSGYGPLTITRSVSIIANPGAFAGIGVFAGSTGITIATAGINVTLRGLTLNGQGGAYGINMTDGAKLSVENCVIAGFTTAGINVATAATVRIVDTLVRDNVRGVQLDGGATASISGSKFLGNSDIGILVGGTTGTTTAAISRSVVTGTGADWGIAAQSTNAAANARAHVFRSSVTNADAGVVAISTAGGGASVVLSRTKVTGNATGLQQSGAGATLTSLQNNSVSSNASNTSGTILTTPPQ